MAELQATERKSDPWLDRPLADRTPGHRPLAGRIPETAGESLLRSPTTDLTALRLLINGTPALSTRYAENVLTAVVMPVRSFDGALSRLAGVLDGPRRAALMRRMASRVVAAAAPYPVYVATDDAEVSGWATGVGASVMSIGRSGLSVAAEVAVERLAAAGVERVAVAHADLALAQTMRPAIGSGLVIVPDLRRDGSNVVCVPTSVGFRFAYGEGSFRRHVAEGERLGLPVTVVDDPTLAVDIDRPDDLRSLPDHELAALGLGDLRGRLEHANNSDNNK